MRLAARIGVLLLLATAGGVGTALVHPRAPAWTEAARSAGGVTVGEARALLAAGALLVDARERYELEAGSLDGAVLLNETEWDALLPGVLERWDGVAPIVVYCSSEACPAARLVRARLERELGFDGVRYLRGGLAAWAEEGNAR